ncbi:MAG: hypothetical protein ACHQQ3_07695 [Gemmatimonadales bacterium]
MNSKLRSAVLAASLVFASGCLVYARPRADVVYVTRRPPPERVEVIATAPSPAHIWIAGHWAWRAPDFVWIAGRWEAPGPGFRRWEPGHWAHDRNGWFWLEGRWR